MPASPNDLTALLAFAQRILTDIGLPILSGGYGRLVRDLRQNQNLAAKAREGGLSAVLASDDPELAGMKKSNKELVTTAEKEAERLMAQAVREVYPTHAIVGEEHGYTPGEGMRWVFDPIDGTSAMIRCALAQAFGIVQPEPSPSFGTTVGLTQGDEAVAGIVIELKPREDGLEAVYTWTGATGVPSTCNGAAIILPAMPATLAQSTLCCTVPEVMFNTAEKWSGWQALFDASAAFIPDLNCVGFMRLLQGGVHIVYEADLAYHDAAALIPVLLGAGMRATDDRGGALQFPESAIPQEFRVLAAAPNLHALALAAILKGVPPEKNRFATGDAVHQGYAQKFPA